ncbi:MAG: SusF/SusE family outer membrane protein [Bacteroidales bacterium]|nr:SusF/SusE family outer membrane protein [Bacteroidales bacterium]
MNKIKYLLIVLVAVFIYSCQEDFETPPAPPSYNNVGPVVTNSVDDTTAVLLKENEDVAWDTLAWNAAVLYEGQGLITHYAIQIDEQGNNFASLFEIESSTTSETEIVITVGNLNTKLLANGYGPVQTYDLELRIKAHVHDDLDSVYSNIYPFTVTTYKDVPVPETLFLFGDATTVGWGADTSLTTYKEEGKYTIFTYLENDKQFRFLETQELEGENDFKYNFNSFAVLPDNVDDAGDDDDNNFKFTGATGWYKIEADYLTSTLTIAEHTVGSETYTYDYDNLYIVGDYNDADPFWDAGNAVAMTKVSEGLFTIEKQLKDGAMFKFLGQQSWGDLDWGNIGGDGNSGTLGPKEFNGNITFDGGDKTYEIEVNIKQGTYTFTEVATLPTSLYMIGNALNLDDSDSNGTPDGWQWELTDAPMIPVYSKPHLFWKIVWLNATGEFKFAPEKAWGNDFGYDSDLGGGEYSIGGTNLPVTGTSGYYMVVVDLEANKISIADPDVYLMGNTVGSWDTANPDAKFTVDNVNEVITITKDLAADEIRMYAWHPYFTDWWQSEFIVLSNIIEFRGNGGDQTRVNVTAGSNTVELNFKTGAGSITHN